MAQNKYHGSKDEAGSILINFVLDKSGSMHSIRDATISGFNEFKNDQAREDGEAFFTLTLFDTGFQTVVEAVPLSDVYDLTRERYVPGGMTALYDAVAHTMRITDEFVAKNHPRQVLFVIMTDGQENASREVRRDDLFAMIKDRQDNAHYEFIYLGANQDSYAVGDSIGLRPGRTIDYAASPAATRNTMRYVSHNVRAHRRMAEEQSAAFFSPDMDALGALDANAWAAMSESEREAMRTKVDNR
ncbi:MAG: VWA domain-containing protein [Actinobacteria bacterium]|nr:MAG: VWA domain-containing protein [Actinomycetota bacterium]